LWGCHPLKRKTWEVQNGVTFVYRRGKKIEIRETKRTKMKEDKHSKAKEKPKRKKEKRAQFMGIFNQTKSVGGWVYKL